jgi:predicted acetyltransferase
MSRDRFEPFTLRPARRTDLASLVQVGISAFRAPTTEERWTRYYADNPHLPPERVVVAERAASLLGSAAMLDLRLAVDGRMTPVDGVAAVAVHPAARRQGVAEGLMHECLLDARQRRTPYSFLYAFRGSFYRRFGYAPVEMGHVVQARPRDLPDSPWRAHVRPYAAADLPAVQRCYRAGVGRRTGPLERSEKWWEWRVLREGQDRVVYTAPDTDRVEGYALAMLIESAPLGERRLGVQELVALNPRALRGLIGWLASLGDEFSLIEMHVPPEASWAPFLRDPNYELATAAHQQQTPAGYLGWGAMARVTHLERALGTRRGRPVRGAVTFELDDPLIPENRAPVTVRFGGPRLTVRAGAHSRSRVRAPIDVFAQVWLGAVAATHARRFGMLEASEEAARLLDAACFGPAPHLGTLNEF